MSLVNRIEVDFGWQGAYNNIFVYQYMNMIDVCTNDRRRNKRGADDIVFVWYVKVSIC